MFYFSLKVMIFFYQESLHRCLKQTIIHQYINTMEQPGYSVYFDKLSIKIITCDLFDSVCRNNMTTLLNYFFETFPRNLTEIQIPRNLTSSFVDQNSKTKHNKSFLIIQKAILTTTTNKFILNINCQRVFKLCKQYPFLLSLGAIHI